MQQFRGDKMGCAICNVNIENRSEQYLGDIELCLSCRGSYSDYEVYQKLDVPLFRGYTPVGLSPEWVYRCWHIAGDVYVFENEDDRQYEVVRRTVDGTDTLLYAGTNETEIMEYLTKKGIICA
jgi:hypothetical protein